MTPNTDTPARRGVFIAIEGSDGSGKGTQFRKLYDRLTAEGYDVETFDFPQYDESSSFFVRQYLNGAYGTAEEVGPYTGSLFFSLDRYEAAPKIRRALDAGKVVITNRFTGSNMAHQGTKFRSAEERRGYFIWLDNLEFQMLKIPRPDYNFVLRVPAEIAQGLVDQKDVRSYTDKKRDIHEADLDHLRKSVEVYDDLCNLFPKDFTRVDCVRGQRLLSIDEVHKLLWEKILPHLPTEPVVRTESAAKQPSVLEPGFDTDSLYIPPALDAATAATYQFALASILQKRHDLLKRLETAAEPAHEAGHMLLPVAAYAGRHPEVNKILSRHTSEHLAEFTKQHLPGNHVSLDGPAITLVDYWPRNEFRALPTILFPYTNLGLRALNDAADGWAYDQKAELLETYGQAGSDPGVKSVGYVFDIVTDIGTLLDLSQLSGFAVSHQAFTPRYGYDVPEGLAELSDVYDECFDLSMELYSELQAAGHDQIAQYATLLGHKAHGLLLVTDADLSGLRPESYPPRLQAFLAELLAVVATTHPILGESRRQLKKPKQA